MTTAKTLWKIDPTHTKEPFKMKHFVILTVDDQKRLPVPTCGRYCTIK